MLYYPLRATENGRVLKNISVRVSNTLSLYNATLITKSDEEQTHLHSYDSRCDPTISLVNTFLNTSQIR